MTQFSFIGSGNLEKYKYATSSYLSALESTSSLCTMMDNIAGNVDSLKGCVELRGDSFLVHLPLRKAPGLSQICHSSNTVGIIV